MHTNHPNQLLPPMHFRVTVVLAVFLLCSFVGILDQTSAQSAPTKARLVQTLRKILPLLQAQKLEQAAELFVMPKGAEPDDLAGLVEKREISAAGIEVLERDAKFGTAVETFGEQRSKVLCERAGVNSESVYGFYHTQNDVTGEVLAKWDGSKFQIMRLDDVGKFENGQPAAAADSVKTPPSQPETPAAKSNSLESTIAKLPALEKLVTDNPNDVGARANYAQALFMIKNYPLAWQQLLIGQKQDPKHVGIRRGMDALVSAFTSLGVFTVGVPPATISGLLSEPQQKVELGNNRERWVYGNWGIDFTDGKLHEIINLAGATQALFQPTETITADLDDRQWIAGFRKKTKDRVLAMMFLPGQMVSNHQERVTIERMLNAASFGTMEEIAKQVIADEQKSHPDSEHKILMVDDSTAMIAAEFPIPGSRESSHELFRLFKADKDVHRLHYLLKSETRPTEEYQKKWFSLFQAAKLERVDAAE